VAAFDENDELDFWHLLKTFAFPKDVSESCTSTASSCSKNPLKGFHCNQNCS